MNRNTRNTIINAIRTYPTITSQILLNEFGRRNRTCAFDNSIMRFIRRMRESGYLHRTTRGVYKLTSTGKRYIKNMA